MTAGNMSSEKTKMIRQSGLQNKSLGLQRLLFTLKSHSTLDPTEGGVGGRDGWGSRDGRRKIETTVLE